jgi:hypothetical protein
MSIMAQRCGKEITQFTGVFKKYGTRISMEGRENVQKNAPLAEQ